MPNLKFLGGLAAVGALLGAIFAAHAWLGRVEANRAQAAEYADCRASAAQEPGAKLPAKACAPPIAKALQDAFQARECDLGLRTSPDPARPGRWIVPTVCSQKVQKLAAGNNVARDTVDARDSELANLRGAQAAALARAETRGANRARREANAKAAIAAAPRNADGLIVCRGLCLRQLAGVDAPDAADRADGRSPPDD